MRNGFDYIGINCVFWCHDGKGKVLLHKRSKNCRDEQGVWDPGAGAMELGETFEETVRREVMEEYGVEPIKIEYITSRNVLRNHDGIPTHWIKNLHLVLVDPAKAPINEPRKMDAIGRFALNALPHPLHSQVLGEVEMLKEYLKLY